MRFNAYTVQEFDTGNGQKARSWTRIGVAFPHKDGTGFNVELNALPLDGRIVLFPPQADERAEDDTEAEAAPAPPPPAPNRANHARRR
jgi:hypothetical protein